MPVKLQPPVGLPSALSLEDETSWLQLVDNQLDSTRKMAENWRNGLAALIGLLTALSLIKGPSELGGLAPQAAYGAGALLLLAMIAAVWGTWSAIEAAYGAPTLMTRDQFREGGGIEGFRLAAAGKTATRLRRAQVLTIVSLLLVVGVVSVLWYAPREPKANVRIQRVSGPSVCGQVGPSSGGQVEIRPPNSAPQSIDFKDISSIVVTAECQ